MARLITLSRAARLVGVKRTTLQKQIQAGELSTFEGQLDLSELLRVYPHTKIEDSTMIERADRMIERALSRVVRDQENLPDAEVLATRIAHLSHELGTANYRVRRYDIFLLQLQDYLRKFATAAAAPTHADINALRDWLDDGLTKLHASSDAEGELFATDMLLRVMAAQVHLEPSAHEFFVQGNDSLLDSGLRAGLALDYGCSDGSCGRCMAKLKSGIVKLVRKPRYRLSEHERAQGYTLMCCHTAVTDVVLEVAEAPQPGHIEPQRLLARVGSVERVADDIAVLSLRPAEGARLRFLAGQSVRLSSDGQSAEYAIASCPCDEHQLEFHIRMRGDDAFAQKLFTALGLNQQVEIEGPHGDFTLDMQSLHQVIFVAWDTGFAPIKSLLEHAMALDAAENLHLFWVHTQDDVPYLHNRCRAWADALENFHYTHLRAESHIYHGDSDAHEILATVLAAIAEPHFDVAAFDIYIAAPAPILEQSRRYFTARGVPAAQLHMLDIPA
ncbi:MAG: 2Fe-2S iron-sulfur cluster binding domain-containing protein [Gammaproteobacteria bacterium]|nr:2Fe-2S iron-sulfur cluster binding domain-containing protein [Gammaproteobacteria bacterium]